jgi:pimeloyl-ACP methyl ester carboxylesterase/predicted ester cyclase
MHISEYGRGPAVVLLHGAPSTRASLAPLVEALAPVRRVLVPDLPGYGATPPVSGRYSVEAVNRLLEDALLARGVREAAVVGFSGGAYRAFGLAVSGRVRLTHLVSLGGFAGLDPDGRKGLREAAALARTGFDFHPVWLARMMGPGAPARFPAEAAEVLQWLDCVPMEVLIAELEAFAEAPDYRPALAQLRIPITARVGAADAAAPPAWSRAICAAAPSAVLQIVDGCGHALLYEDRDATVRAVCEGVGVSPDTNKRSTMSGPGTNEKIYRDAIDAVWHRGDLSVVEKVWAPDYVGTMSYYSRRGPAGVVKVVAETKEAIQDLRYDVDQVIEQGDMLAVRWTLSGRFVGVLYGVKGSGKRIRASGMTFNRFRDGKIVEGRMVMDTSFLLAESAGVVAPASPDRVFT